ncbi:unnamed protein product, partial [Gulo gulo]
MALDVPAMRHTDNINIYEVIAQPHGAKHRLLTVPEAVASLLRTQREHTLHEDRILSILLLTVSPESCSG